MTAETHRRDSTIPPEPERYPVVLIDGNTGARRTALHALGRRGYKAHAAADATAAIELARREGPTVLVVDADDDLNGGLALAQRVSRACDEAEIVLAARATPETLLRVIDVGVFRFLRKPYDPEELLASIAGAANRLFLRLDRRRRMAMLEARNRDLEVAVARLEESETRRALAERLASVGQFASALGHEMNGPLAYVQTNLDLARAWVEEAGRAFDAWRAGTPWDAVAPERQARLQADFGQLPAALEDCNTGLRFMRQLSRDLGAVARYRTDERALFDLNEVVSTSCRIARVKVLPPHRLEVVLAREPVGVLGSPGRIAQVVLNLVSNAVDAAARGRPNTITVSTGTRGHEAYLAVSDTGVGIPVERRERIFESYVSYRDGGTGIGLGVVRHIVEEHRGRVELESEVGVGSCFRVLLPRSEVPAFDASTSSSSTPPQVLAGGRVLLVDDDELVRRGIGRALDGLEVVSVAGVREALEALEAGLPDVVVTDVDMPGLDGLALHAAVAARHPALARRFLFVTGDRSRVPEGLGLVLEKPFGAARLRKMVLKAMG